MRWHRRSPGLITIAAVAVAIGLLPLPYEYYMLLRFFMCGVSVYFLTQPRGVRDAEQWVLVALVVLHNPIAPVPLGSKLRWSIVNVATVAWFWRLDRRPRYLHETDHCRWRDASRSPEIRNGSPPRCEARAHPPGRWRRSRECTHSLPHAARSGRRPPRFKPEVK